MLSWKALRVLWAILRLGLLGLGTLLVVWLIGQLCPGLRRPEPRPRRPSGRSDCQPVSPTIYHRPDPLIYDQYYLMAQGIAVTWDNPDIVISLNGNPVNAHDLKPATTYDVTARVWNASTDAPVAQLPVQLSYLSFGIGTQSHPIGLTYIDLGVKGSLACPSYAQFAWTTPTTPAHYCLQAEFAWSDDANPANNLGQTNTDVQPLHSPAEFTFPIANHGRSRQVLTLRHDAYALPALDPCGRTPDENTGLSRRKIASQLASQQALPHGWSVDVQPSSLTLNPGQERMVRVVVTAPNGFVGAQPINVNAFANDRLVGGVTLVSHS